MYTGVSILNCNGKGSPAAYLVPIAEPCTEEHNARGDSDVGF